MNSPYNQTKPNTWLATTEKLIDAHPLSSIEIVEVVLAAWDDIFVTKIGKRKYGIGREINPKPQIMGFFLHELIPLEFERRYPKKWRREKSASDKDLIYIPGDKFSVEIKTSSDPKSIFGNRSYAQESAKGKKSKSGYMMAVNFEKFDELHTKPKIKKIRFGWLDHHDWIGQKAATGQQARLSIDVQDAKLITLYPLE